MILISEGRVSRPTMKSRMTGADLLQRIEDLRALGDEPKGGAAKGDSHEDLSNDRRLIEAMEELPCELRRSEDDEDLKQDVFGDHWRTI